MDSGDQAAKESRNRKIKALRERKSLDPNRLTGANAPSTAFVVMGHGNERSETKIVPEGCILVVKTHSGEYGYGGNETSIGIFNHPHKSIFLDPITNYKEIVDCINETQYSGKTLAIYREGDEYPDFFYSLLAKWDSDNPQYSFGQENSYLLKNSGIAQYPFNTNGGWSSDLQRYFETVVPKDSPGRDVFLQLYMKSIYPRYYDFWPILDTLEQPVTMQKIIESPELESLINITQSQLFTKLGKGVYYNLVCRSTNLQKFRRLDGETVINNSERKLVNNSGHLIKNGKREILQQIIEAEGHRQGYIAKLNKNNSSHNPLVIPVAHSLIPEQYKSIEQLDTSIDKVIKEQMHEEGTKERIDRILSLNYKPLMDLYNLKIKEYTKYRDAKDTEPEFKQKFNDIINQWTNKKTFLESRVNRSTNKKFNRRPNLNESALKEKQRAAHTSAINKASENNIKNSSTFEKRRANAETEAAAAVAKWKKKIPIEEYNYDKIMNEHYAAEHLPSAQGGRRTRRVKKYKNKTRRK